MTKITTGIISLLCDIANLRQEHFICFSLDCDQEIIQRRTVFIGTLTSVLIHPREIWAGAIADTAASIIVAHNHPSNEPRPSKQDIAMTQQLVAAGQILGVPLLDHIIVSGKRHFSFREGGLLGSVIDELTKEVSPYERPTN
jgi:DNA repair protein RadC